ncbi:methyltransferase, FxLD system [Nonomuraea sp. C10]|uniref:methyltransferase, FxLD system n=1 Tax=Nonomuraea sp. C10 TaxID=2600577 RepID=UPI0011CE6374|nr:methyltransferase, FxLD system [Nonomuraea sp. C10]TXK41482.1 methyltransferase, FxLD system [Nonomuraea sp. C10]
MNTDSTSPWRQVNMTSDDWRAAESIAASHLRPLLAEAEQHRVITSWWYTRKGPQWLIRCMPAPGKDDEAAALLREAMGGLRERGDIAQWVWGMYEPEIHPFGGVEAMNVAHDLFHADSRNILHYLHQLDDRLLDRDHRRELGLMLASTLLRGAGLDWYEQGDVWDKVAAHRPAALPASFPNQVTDVELAAVRTLITARGSSPSSPLAAAPDWTGAFHETGVRLAALAKSGRLTRGLRSVLAHHVLFAWNRVGISARHQAFFSATAARVVFHHTPGIEDAPTSRQLPSPAATLSSVTTRTDTDPSPERLRDELADHIRDRGTFKSERVEAVFRTVPRHLFLPGVDLRDAYAPKVVTTKYGADGSAISSASSPNLVAAMLEQLDIRPGHRVLEIGAGTGFNAALMAELAGPDGRVVTIDIDDDIVQEARRGLRAAGYEQVEVICGDGADGHPAGGPYDRLIVTAGAWDLTAAWWRQLAEGGRMVVPVLLHDSGLTRSLAFDRDQPDRMVSTSALVCGFVPMRGSTFHAGRELQLAHDVVLHLDGSPSQEGEHLPQALKHPAHQVWTGIRIRDDQPVGHLDLWLVTTGSRFARLAAGPQARDRGLVTPAPRWSGATLYDDTSIAYLALRPLDKHVPGRQTHELGVIAHGPESAKLAEQTAELLHEWDRERPSRPFITAHPAGTLDEQLSPGYRIDRPGARLTVVC